MRGKKGKTKTCWKPSQAPHLLFASTFQRTGPRWGVLHPHGPGVLPWLCAGLDDGAATSRVPRLDQHVVVAALRYGVIVMLSHGLVCRCSSQGLPLKQN